MPPSEPGRRPASGYEPPQEQFELVMLLEEASPLIRPRLQPGVEVICNANGVGQVVGSRQFLKQVKNLGQRAGGC